ncbi:MAG: hypothetical protein K2X45_13845 [Phreatobacter sp.]|nr:hypothetical protein [Phreatobacter sp.]
MADELPWRTDAREPLSLDERRLAARLAVLSAWDAARTAEDKRRGRRELLLNLRRGDPLLGGARLPDLLETASDSDPRGLMVREFARQTAQRLRIKAGTDAELAAALREVAMGRRYQGRAVKVETTAFIERLAGWWWHATGRRPERQMNAIRHEGGPVTFVAFALAALSDANGGGHAPAPGAMSRIRRVVEAMEREKRVPWA